jgi:hypothetical protein
MGMYAGFKRAVVLLVTLKYAGGRIVSGCGALLPQTNNSLPARGDKEGRNGHVD